MGPSINAIVPWFGTKRILAPEIVKQIGDHRAYFEPFCGSMAVLLAKPVATYELVNDLHGDLINLARVIRDPQHGAWLYRQLRRTLVSEEVYRDACQEINAGLLNGEMDQQRALAFFVYSWLGRNGVQGTAKVSPIGKQFSVRWTANGGSQGTRFCSAVDSIPAWRERLRKVSILRRDGFECIAEIADEPRMAIYVDPPYVSKGARYIHDFEPADHVRLAQLLERFRRVRVVVSYYDHPQLRNLYPAKRWQTLDCARYKNMARCMKRGHGDPGTIAPEVLLVNGPLADGPQLEMFA